jgi:hypothetical protein
MRREILTFGALLTIAIGAPGRAEAGLSFGDILVSDVGNAAIYDVNPTTGARIVFSESGVAGTGVALNSPQGIAFDALGFVVVADSELNALVKIDPLTGNRTILSGMGTMGTGARFNNPIGTTTDAAGNIYVADQGGFTGIGEVFKVDPTTGNRRVISGNGIGTGTVFDNIGGIALVGGKLVVTDSGDFATASAVYSVDPTTGNRTVVASGGSLDNVRGVMMGPSGTVYTANGGGGFPSFSGPGSIVNLTLSSGMQATTSGGTGAVGSGPAFANPYDLATGVNGLLYVTDAGDSSIGTPTELFTVNPTTGLRTVLSGGGAGSGTAFGLLGFGIAVDMIPAASIVPEPAAFVLLGQGLAAGLVLLRLRLRRRIRA